MKTNFLRITAALALLGPWASTHAAFHLWDISEVYSNADGSVLFIELFCSVDGQQFLDGHELNASSDGNVVQFVFPSDSGSPTGNQFLLLATPGFDALPGGVTPDFILPAGFFDPTAETISLDFGPGQDVFNFGRADLPTNGRHSLNRDSTTGINTPTNFVGTVGEVTDNLIYPDSLEALCELAYPDTDSDTFGDANSPGVEMCALTSGFVRNNDDCFDGNSDARPGQTQFFTNHRGDMSYDYNCNNLQDQQLPDLVSCSPPPACDTLTQGWLGNTIPACGQTQSFGATCFLDMFVCDATAQPITQGCR